MTCCLPTREAKQVGSTKNLADVINDYGSIESVRCNCNGSRVSVLVNKVSHLNNAQLLADLMPN